MDILNSNCLVVKFKLFFEIHTEIGTLASYANPCRGYNLAIKRFITKRYRPTEAENLAVASAGITKFEVPGPALALVTHFLINVPIWTYLPKKIWDYPEISNINI